MFDTERFILEVQNRICLWDSREISYSDRTAKRRAWEEIGKLFYDSWEDETEKKRQEFVQELQKKWKHLRDYHVKEKKDENTRSGSAAPKRRKNSYIEFLRFLDVVKEPRITTGNISAPVGSSTNDSTENTCEESAINSHSNSITSSRQTTNENSPSAQADVVPGTSQTTKKYKMTAFQQSLIAAMNKKQQQPSPKEDDADTKFLLSLLPQIKSLDERQNCEFRLEVMNLIYKIKYRSPYNMSHGQYYVNQPRYETSPPDYHQGYTSTYSSLPNVQSPKVQSPQLSETQEIQSQNSSIEEEIYEILK